MQGIWNDTNGVMIICFYKKAAEILLQQQDFEIDMSYKRIRQANMNEILFARFLEAHNKSKIRMSYISHSALIHLSLHFRSHYCLLGYNRDVPSRISTVL